MILVIFLQLFNTSWVINSEQEISLKKILHHWSISNMCFKSTNQMLKLLDWSTNLILSGTTISKNDSFRSNKDLT